MVETKADIVTEIAQRLGTPTPRMSTGSTEPREIFELANEVLGLGIPSGLTKPELASAIVESSGESWNADFESSGGTVTKKGLLAVAKAVGFFTGA